MNEPLSDPPTSSLVRKLATIAIGGPLLFLLLLVVVAAVQWDSLHERGWRLLDHGDVTWPSGTALGPYGYLQVVNFLVLGLAILSLALAINRAVQVSRNVTSWLVGLLGVAVLLSAIRIDEPTAFGGEGGSPDTWNGVVHGIAFLLVVLSSLASMIAAGFQFRRDPRWAGLARPSFAAAAALPATLLGIGALNGALGVYLFLGVLLAWIAALGWRAHRLAQP